MTMLLVCMFTVYTFYRCFRSRLFLLTKKTFAAAQCAVNASSSLTRLEFTASLWCIIFPCADLMSCGFVRYRAVQAGSPGAQVCGRLGRLGVSLLRGVRTRISSPNPSSLARHSVVLPLPVSL